MLPARRPIRARALAVVAVLTSFSLPASAEPRGPAVFSVLAGADHGSAFLATRIPGIDGPALVTALHVVGGYKHVELRVRDCDEATPFVGENQKATFTFDADAEVLAWPELDLVAFPLADGTTLPTTALGDRPLHVDRGSSVDVLGMSKFSPCPYGNGTFLSTRSTKELVRHLQERTEYKASDLGTLSQTSWLLFLNSSGGPGVSGGAVLDDQGRLLGLYQGGGTDPNSPNWAVRISIADLEAFPVRRKKLKELKGVSAARLTESQQQEFVRTVTRELPTGAFLALQGSFFKEVLDPGAVGWKGEIAGFAPLKPGLNTSLGAFLASGFAIGESFRIVRGPFDEDDDAVERTDADFKQLTGTIGLGMRFFQQSWLRIGAAVGYRVGGRWVEDTPQGGTRLRITHGGELRSYPCASLLWQLSLCVPLSAGLAVFQPEQYRVRLGQSAASPDPARLQVDVSVGASLAWGSWIRIKQLEINP